MKHALLAICICPVALGCGHTLQVDESEPAPGHFKRTGAEMAEEMRAPGSRPDADGASRSPSGNGYLAHIRSTTPFNPASDASIRRHFRLLRAVTTRPLAIERLATVERTRVARLLVEHVEARKPIVNPFLEGVATWNLPRFFLGAGVALHKCGCYDVLLKMAEDPNANETTRGAASFLLGLCAATGEAWGRVERPVIDRSEQVESCAAFLEKTMKHSSGEIRLYALCAYSFLVDYLPDASVALRHAERLSKEDPSLLVRMRAIQFLDGLKNLRVRSTERKGQ